MGCKTPSKNDTSVVLTVEVALQMAFCMLAVRDATEALEAVALGT